MSTPCAGPTEGEEDPRVRRLAVFLHSEEFSSDFDEEGVDRAYYLSVAREYLDAADGK